MIYNDFRLQNYEKQNKPARKKELQSLVKVYKAIILTARRIAFITRKVMFKKSYSVLP